MSAGTLTKTPAGFLNALVLTGTYRLNRLLVETLGVIIINDSQ